MIKSLGVFFARTWVTGALYFLGILGYIFYGILWVIRFMQSSKRFIVIAIIGFILLLSFFATFLFVPFNRSTDTIDFQIQKGSSLKTVAESLKKNKVIPSAMAFVVYVKLTGNDTKIQAGNFVLFGGDGIIAASKKLLHATAVDVLVTIPEGLTIEQTASVLKRSLGTDSTEFVKLCYTPSLFPELSLTGTSLEGYLFPDSYRFPPNSKPDVVIRHMVSQFKEKYCLLKNDSLCENKLSRQESVILASIVEKEAAIASERPLIAGVFHNRLKRHIPLGADPTIRYFLKKLNGPLYVSELNSETPYNTRKYEGLPPGPICSPGLASLNAALNPESTKFLYFVAKWDGSGNHDFSVTNAEHTRKKNEIRRMNEIRKMKTTVKKEKV